MHRKPKDSTKKLELTNENSVKPHDTKINIQKSVTFLHANNEETEK